MNKWASDIFKLRYALTPDETWEDCCDRVTTAIGYSQIRKHMIDRSFIFGGRYLASAGKPLHNISNCFAERVEDSREGWAKLLSDVSMITMLGGGIGVVYSDIRPNGSIIKSTGSMAGGPLGLMEAVDSVTAQIRSGGGRRGACWAGLHWWHPDVRDFIKMKHSRTKMHCTNISVIFDTSWFVAMEAGDLEAKAIFDLVYQSAIEFGDPGFSFDYGKDNECLRNPCAEMVSSTSGDSCNLGTIFLPHIRDVDHMAQVTKHAVKAMLRGALYSSPVTEQIQKVRMENNRLGLGLGGIGHWLLQRGHGYEMVPELRKLMEVWAEVSEVEGTKYAKKLGMNVPKAFRAIAPNGTLGILAGTTGGIEPLFCKSYIRTYNDMDKKMQRYVVDPVVKELQERGIPLEQIYDSYDIDPGQRVEFQREVQKYVDNAISSTVNLPNIVCPTTFSGLRTAILDNAIHLRGITVYRDGAIGGQPLERCSLEEALHHEGLTWEAKEDTCKGGVCGI